MKRVYKIALASIASRKSLAIAKSIKTVLGGKILGISHRRHPFNYSSLFDEVIVVEESRGGATWGSLVVDIAVKKGADVVVPVDFLDVVSLSRLRNPPLPVAAPTYDAVALASNKATLPELLGYDVVPPLVVVNSQDDKAKIVKLTPPVVVKGLSDASSPEFFTDLEEAGKAATSRIPCIVQEYIPGRARGYEAIAYKGEPLIEFTHERTVEYDPGGGPSLGARGPILDPNLYRLGRLVLRRLSWTGPLMVETKWIPQEGRYYIVELNPKFWGSLDLPVSLGYHLPAVLIKAVLEGPEEAQKLAKSLYVKKGEFYWVLDGFRYLAKIPSTWFYMLRRAKHSDISVSDPARVVLQLSVAIKKLRDEKQRWIQSIHRDYKKAARMFTQIFDLKNPILILDFDGVIVDLKVDWNRVSKVLESKKLKLPWESISAMFNRLWKTDPEMYAKVSQLVEAFEDKAQADVIISEDELKGVDFCIVSLQSTPTIKRFIPTGKVYGRDSGFGPRKKDMIQACLKNFDQKRGAVFFDDDLYNCIVALRQGLYPIRVVQNMYKGVETLRVGIPFIEKRYIKKVIKLLYKE